MNIQETFKKIRGCTPPLFQFIVWLTIYLPIMAVWNVIFWLTSFITLMVFTPSNKYDNVERKFMTSKFNPDKAERERWINHKL